jgi:deoxyribose-phosphate aldolase
MTEHASEVIGSAGLQLSRSELAQMIDISAVQAFHTEEDVRNLAGLALAQRFIAAHARPHFVPLLRSLIPVGGSTFVGGPVGFTSGGHTTAIKVEEARSLAGLAPMSST